MDPGFVDADKLDFRLREDSTVYRKIPGFRRIPFAKIGLYADEFRTTVPEYRRELARRVRAVALDRVAAQHLQQVPDHGVLHPFRDHLAAQVVTQVVGKYIVGITAENPGTAGIASK